MAERGMIKEGDRRPDVGRAIDLVQDFYALDTARQIGMSRGPIPVTAIFVYADRYDLGERFVRSIQSLDAFYLRETNRNGPPSKGSVSKNVVQKAPQHSSSDAGRKEVSRGGVG